MNDETQTQGDDVTPISATAVTDTVATPASEADVQANETPNAADAQEATVNAEDTVAESKLYAGKYKSVEDLEKSYTELQSKFTNTTQEKAELSRILADAFTQEQVPQLAQVEEDGYDEVPSQINPQQSGIQKDLAVLKFTIANPDANGDAMVKILQSDPVVKQIPSFEAQLQYAYTLSQNIAQPKAVEEAKKQAQVESQAKFVEKQAAQVESGSVQSPPTKEEPLTQEQLREALQDDKSFGELLKKREGFKEFLA